MEELIPALKNMLSTAVKIIEDEDNLVITLVINDTENIIRNLAEPKEVKTMLRMFGGLKEEIKMEIEIDEEAKTINMKFNFKEDMDKVREVLDNLWDRIEQLLGQAMMGSLDGFKDLGDFDD